MPGTSHLPLDQTPVELLPFDGSALLVPAFLADDEADEMFMALQSEIPWESTTLVMFGSEVAEPRLSAWMGDVGATYGYSGRTRVTRPWTTTLANLRRQLESHIGSEFNGVLANLYRDGRDHMGWHADDEKSLGPEPTIASISLGAQRRFDLRHRVSGDVISCTLPHGSLLVMSGLSQSCWKHRLARTTRAVGPRLNLTFRRITNP